MINEINYICEDYNTVTAYYFISDNVFKLRLRD